MPTTSDTCSFCERAVVSDDTNLHHICSRRVDADARTERVACDHCFDDVRAGTRDLDAHEPEGLVDHGCSLCGSALDPDACVERLTVDEDWYALCATCTSAFEEFCLGVPEREPADPVVGDAGGPGEAVADPEETARAVSDPAGTIEVIADGGDPNDDSMDLGTVLDSGLDDVEVDDRVGFDVRADTGNDVSATVDTVRGDVTRAETSYIGGSTVYVDGDDGEEYRLESSFSSEAVRITTIHGHDLRFEGHLDELRVDR
jgi:hypothetical protein